MEVTPQDEVEEIAQLVSIVHKQPEDHSTSTTTAHFPQTKSDASVEDNARINEKKFLLLPSRQPEGCATMILNT